MNNEKSFEEQAMAVASILNDHISESENVMDYVNEGPHLQQVLLGPTEQLIAIVKCSKEQIEKHDKQ